MSDLTEARDLTDLGDGWTILPADPLTGQLIDDAERAFRERIRAEAREGMVGVDTLYLSAHRRIHQPLTTEQGQVSGDGWILERPNNTTLRVAYSEGLESPALAELAVTIARAAINDFAAEVMLTLFAIANDPPNWRRPQLTISLNDLLDRLGFTRDNRGVHRSDARKKLSTTLLSLHLMHIGVQQRARRRGAQSVGFIAPLLSAIAYATNEEIGHLSPIEVFRQGLPERSLSTLIRSGTRVCANRTAIQVRSTVCCHAPPYHNQAGAPGAGRARRRRASCGSICSRTARPSVSIRPR